MGKFKEFLERRKKTVACAIVALTSLIAIPTLAVVVSYDVEVQSVILRYNGHKYITFYKYDDTGHLAYCLEPTKESPKGMSMQAIGNTNDQIYTLLKYGHPYHAYSNDHMMEYFITQTALWQLNQDIDVNNSSIVVDKNIKATGSHYTSSGSSYTGPFTPEYFKACVNDLVAKARTQTETQNGTVSVSPKSSSGVLNGDYLISESFKISGSPSTLNNEGSLTLTASKTVPGMKIIKDGTYYDLSQIKLKVGDTIKVAVPKYTPSDTIKFKVTGTYKATRSVHYDSPRSDYQDVAIYKPVEVDASVVDAFSFSWMKEYIKGTIRIRKMDSQTKESLSGAVFALYQNNVKMDEATVQPNGIAIFNNVTIGNFEIREIKPPINYRQSANVIKGTIDDGNQDIALDYDFYNDPLKHTISVVKIDAVTKQPLQGATMGLYKDEVLIESVVTGSDGVATFSRVPKANYKIKEINAPIGYEINRTPIEVNIPDSKESRTLQYTMEDSYLKHNVKIYKVDAGTKAPLSGAKFGIYKDGTLIKEATSNSNGVAEFTGITEGTYTVKELSAPFNYALSTEVKTITIGKVSAPTVFEATFTNTPLKHKLKVLKVDAVTNEPISGVGFGLYQGSTLIAKGTTGSDGTYTFSDLPVGDYTLRELNTPQNYKPLDGDIAVTISKNATSQTYTKKVSNEPLRHSIQIRKNDRESGVFLENAQFEIYKGDTKLQTVTTDSSGVATFTQLLKGDYTIKEIKAPNGYKLLTEPINVSIGNSTSPQMIQKVVGNEKIKHNIEVTKKASDTKALLDGAEFTLYRTSDNKQIAKVVTKNGIASFTGIEPGTYYLKETKAPPFYNITTDKIPVTISVTNTVQTIKKEVTNDPVKHKVTVIKKDAETDELLQGAEIGLYKDDKLLESKLTDSKGEVEFTNLPKGNYTAKEIKPPVNYSLSNTILQFDFSTSEVDTTKTGEILNYKLKHMVKVTKTDSENKQPVVGASFAILKNGVVVDKSTTDSKGIAVFTGLVKGDYVIKEIKAPPNYILSTEEIPVSIGDSTSVQTINKEFKNTPIKHSVKLTKTDAENGAKLANAVYGIYQGDTLLQQQTTNSSGVATFTNLRKGSYTVKEITPPVNYQLSTEVIPVEIGNSDKATVVEITAKDTPIKHSVKVVKKDSETKEVLEGASLALLKDGTVIQKGTTGKDGIVTFTNLNKGTYTIKEIKPPVNYSLSTDTVEVTIGDSTKPTVVTKDFVNTPIKHSVELVKTDAETDAKIENAVYGIYQGDKLLQQATTNKDGIATFTGLRKGSYYLQEIKAPINFELSDEKIPIEIGDNTKPTVVKATAEDEPVRHTVKVTKKDAETNTTLAGAKFGIYKGKTLLQEATTNAQGVATFTGLRKDNYVIKEITPPINFTLSDAEINVEIGDSDKPTVIEKEFSNTPIKHTVEIVKKDEETKKVLQGAVFGIYKNDQLIKQATSDENGVATFTGLRKDNYTVKEITPPINYHPSDEAININIEDSTKPLTIREEFTNVAIRHKIKIIKKDSESKETLAGAKFELYQGDKLLQTAETNDKGEALFDNLLQGDYTVKEIKAPINYSLSTEVLDITIPNATTNQVITRDYENDKLRHNIKIVKKDAETGEKLKDAKFGIYKDNKLLQEVTTGEDGSATFTGLIKDNYVIKEITPPINYHLSTEPIPVEIPDTDKVLTIEKECRNQPIKHTINVTKKDKDSKETLTGAVFAIYQGDKKLQEVTVNENGVASFTNLLKGDYIIKEVKAPINYAFSEEEIKVSIPDSTSPRTIEKEFLNEKLRHNIEVLKVDSETKEPLADAEFALYKGDQLITTAVSGKDGIARFTDLLKDNYTVKEIRQPINYEISREVLTFNIPDCTESKTFKQELKNNRIKHFIKIKKTDSETGSLLEGTKFGLYSGDKLLQEATTNSLGIAMFDFVDKGEYLIKELEPSINYHNDSKPQKLVIEDALESRMFTLDFTNSPIKHTIQITKQDAETEDCLEGAKFGLFLKDELIQEGTTNADGIVEFTGVLKGNYTVKELTPPINYSPSDEVISIEIPDSTEPNVFKATYKNDALRHSIKVTKKDADTGDVLEGAVFGLFKGDDKIQEQTTDENGVATFDNLLKGNYEIKELTPPVGYELSEEVISIEMEDATESKVIEKEYFNEPTRFKVKINKIDSESEEPLANVKFILLDNDNRVHYWLLNEDEEKEPYLVSEDSISEDELSKLLTTEEEEYNKQGYSSILTTDENGEVILPSAIRFNSYKLVEVEGQSGYKKLQEPIEFTVTPDTKFEDKDTIKGKIVNFISSLTDDTVGEIVDGELIYPIEVENELGEGTMELTKTDISTGELIPNAKFKIYGEDKETVITKGTTDENGIAKFVLKTGKYYYQEYEAPAGYMLDSSLFDFEIKEDGDIVKCEMTNTKLPKTGSVDNSSNIVLYSIGGLGILGILVLAYIVYKKKH